MGDSSGFNDSVAIAVTGKIMMVAIIVLFLVIIFVIFLHLYAKWFWYRREEEASAVVSVADTVTTRRRHRLDFTPGSGASALRRGLDSSLLKSLPTVIFNAKEFKNGLECAVCLSELVDGEKTRLLPKCNHGFHLDCIDMWFQSHSTCPLCRNPVSLTQPEFQLRPENPAAAAVGVYSIETPNFPTNVLFWGNQTRVSTLGASMEDRQAPTTSSSQSSSSTSSISNTPDGCLLIHIPRQIDEEEETKSPVTTRLRSLRRLLSRDRRLNPFTPRADPEQQISRGQS